MHSRRNFLIGVGAALAAPAIVRAESLMLIVPKRAKLIALLPAGTYEAALFEILAWHNPMYAMPLHSSGREQAVKWSS
jgi:hypothetical protein